MQTSKRATAPKKTGGPSGFEVGRAMLIDLVKSYRGDSDVFTEAEKQALVAGFNQEQALEYSALLCVHEYVLMAFTTYKMFNMFIKKYIAFIRSVLKQMCFSELENVRVKDQPRIMTQQQYDELRGSYRGAVAILQPGENYPTGQIDEREHFHALEPYWREAYMAETVLRDHRKTIEACLIEIKKCIVEVYARRAFLEVLSDVCNVPDLMILHQEFDHEQITALNHLMKESIEAVSVRYGARPGERPVDEMKQELKAFLRPINYKSYKTTARMVKAAKDSFDFKNMRVRAEYLIKPLKRGKGVF